jgi:hypothetical protein
MINVLRRKLTQHINLKFRSSYLINTFYNLTHLELGIISQPISATQDKLIQVSLDLL